MGSHKGDDVYFITGSLQLLLTLVLFSPSIICYPVVKIFKTNKYGSCIGKLLFINGVIQCLMGITMMINSVERDLSHNFVFEGFALCQQALYYLIILFMGGIYNEQKYDYHFNKIIALMVCYDYILCQFVS